jgi:hypothetical protein
LRRGGFYHICFKWEAQGQIWDFNLHNDISVELLSLLTADYYSVPLMQELTVGLYPGQVQTTTLHHILIFKSYFNKVLTISCWSSKLSFSRRLKNSMKQSFLEKLTVDQLVKILIAFLGSQYFITVFI